MLSSLSDNWVLKLLSLAFALVLWFFVMGERKLEVHVLDYAGDLYGRSQQQLRACCEGRGRKPQRQGGERQAAPDHEGPGDAASPGRGTGLGGAGRVGVERDLRSGRGRHSVHLVGIRWGRY